MNTHYTYFLILAVALAGPLALSFDKKVAFYTKWKYLFPAMVLPAVFYIGWDIYFASTGIWSFNNNYIIGIRWINLPVEEVLFFFVVPYCCVFIYECIRCYFPDLKNKRTADIFMKALAIILLIAGVIFYRKMYTASVLIFCSIFIMILFGWRKSWRNFDASSFLFAFGIVLIPFLIVNGFLTALPVVLYNDAENLGIRLYTIPFEDVFYGMLLIMMNIALYEKLRNGVKV